MVKRLFCVCLVTMRDPWYAAFELKKLELSHSQKHLQTVYNVGGLTNGALSDMTQRLIDEQLAARAAAVLPRPSQPQVPVVANEQPATRAVAVLTRPEAQVIVNKTESRPAVRASSTSIINKHDKAADQHLRKRKRWSFSRLFS